MATTTLIVFLFISIFASLLVLSDGQTSTTTRATTRATTPTTRTTHHTTKMTASTTPHGHSTSAKPKPSSAQTAVISVPLILLTACYAALRW